MDYQETIEWLFAQLPMFQREGQAAYKGNLDNTLRLDHHFNSPHRRFSTIHVGGTNGKGSVSHMLASVLQESGYKTGLYTSPHLKDFRERLKINGQMIPEAAVIDFGERHRPLFSEIKPSFFEMTVAMAFAYFAEQQVDIAVIEVGLGGRLDSTNIITPLLSIVTNISLDHVALLGDTLEKIASEKAGILKPGIPAIIGTRDPATDHVFERKAAGQATPLQFASDNWTCLRHDNNTYELTNRQGITYHLAPELKGHCQRKNIPAVLEAILELRRAGLHIPDDALLAGIARVIRNTGLYGRWQELSRTPYTVCDTGHNLDGITESVAQIASCRYDHLHVVIGMVNDKDIDNILRVLPPLATYYFTKASLPRALDERVLAGKARAIGLRGNCYPTVPAAIAAATAAAATGDMIYIGGSTFIVAEALPDHLP
jgi:dihydrofolate synthase/folylpolyglutamate synthase